MDAAIEDRLQMSMHDMSHEEARNTLIELQSQYISTSFMASARTYGMEMDRSPHWMVIKSHLANLA